MSRPRVLARNAASARRRCGAELGLNRMREQRADHDRAGHDVLVVRGDAADQQDRRNEAEHDGAENRPRDRADAAGEARAADDNGGNRSEQVDRPDRRVTARRQAAEHDARERRTHPGRGVGEHANPDDADARREARRFAATERLKADPEVGAPQKHPARDHREHKPQPGDWHVAAADVAGRPVRQPLRHRAARARQDVQRDAEVDRARRERCDQRCDPHVTHDQPVYEAGRGADREDDDDRPSAEAVAVEHGERDVADRDHAADRQVDAVGQDDERLTDSGQRQRQRIVGYAERLDAAKRPSCSRQVDDEQNGDEQA